MRLKFYWSFRLWWFIYNKDFLILKCFFFQQILILQTWVDYDIKLMIPFLYFLYEFYTWSINSLKIDWFSIKEAWDWKFYLHGVFYYQGLYIYQIMNETGDNIIKDYIYSKLWIIFLTYNPAFYLLHIHIAIHFYFMYHCKLSWLP